MIGTIEASKIIDKAGIGEIQAYRRLIIRGRNRVEMTGNRQLWHQPSPAQGFHMKDQKVKNPGCCRTLNLSSASLAVDMASLPVPAVARSAPESEVEVEGETGASSIAPIIEPFPPGVCFAIIVTLSAILWTIIAGVVFAFFW